MRTIFVTTVCLAGLSSLAAFAQQAPSLAIAGAQATPVLVKKYPSQPAPSAAAMPQEGAVTGTITGSWRASGGKRSEPLDFTRFNPQADQAQAGTRLYGNLSELRGDWRGTKVGLRGVRRPMVLHLAKLANGALSATLDVLMPPKGEPKLGLAARLVEYQPPRLRINWPGTGSYEGVFMPGTTPGPSFAQGSPLEEVLHALDVQLADRLGAMHMFTVLEESDLKQTIKCPNGQSNQVCNLKNPAIAMQYKSAEIDYLLVTTLEDFEDQTLDLMQGKAEVARVDVKGAREYQDQFEASGSRSDGRSKNKSGVSSSTETAVSGNAHGSSSVTLSGRATAAQLDSSAQKAQTVRLGVRFQLYHAANGARLASVGYTFQTNRTYTAVAGGSNSKATTDFYQYAAQNCAAWATSQITDAVFPIKVLEKNDGMILIERGDGAGLQVGQVFRIYSLGKEVKDPGTGEVRGRDETIVGRVYISEIGPKFSKAKILDDTGIAVGAILRRL